MNFLLLYSETIPVLTLLRFVASFGFANISWFGQFYLQYGNSAIEFFLYVKIYING